jgi:hypothetical protein
MSCNIHALGFNGLSAGAPVWTSATGAFTAAFTDNGNGDVDVNLHGDRGMDETESVWLLHARAAAAPSAMNSPGIVHTSDLIKRLTCLQEGGGGAISALADYDFDVACLREGGFPGGHIVAAGSIVIGAGVPSWLWHSSAFLDAIVDNAAGDHSIALHADRGRVDGAGMWFFSPRGAYVASSIATAGIVHTSTVLKRITTTQEQAAGGASILADIALDVVVMAEGPAPPGHSLYIHALGSIVNAGVPTYTGGWHSGALLDAITDNGVGDVSINLHADRGIDLNKCAIICCPHLAAAAAGLRHISVVHTSDTAKQITCGDEGGGGGASAAADFDFDFAIIGERGP